jgi:cobalamin biosynthesis protein CobT
MRKSLNNMYSYTNKSIDINKNILDSLKQKEKPITIKRYQNKIEKKYLLKFNEINKIRNNKNHIYHEIKSFSGEKQKQKQIIKEKIKEKEKEKEKDDKKENNNSITDKKENDENTKKEENNENNNKEKENNINEEKDAENKEEKIVEYETYLNTPEIFTILPLIGCRILNLIEEEHLMNDLKEKLIRGRYLSKSDFMEYHFWFEPDFEYQNEDIMFQQMLEENKDNNNLGVEDYNKSKKMNVKEFLFNLWKDEKGDKMDFQQFIGVLKINKYITDLNALKEQNYYNIIFKSEN